MRKSDEERKSFWWERKKNKDVERKKKFCGLWVMRWIRWTNHFRILYLSIFWIYTDFILENKCHNNYNHQYHIHIYYYYYYTYYILFSLILCAEKAIYQYYDKYYIIIIIVIIVFILLHVTRGYIVPQFHICMMMMTCSIVFTSKLN